MKPLNQPLIRNLLLMITICGVGAMITACDDNDNNSPALQNGGYQLTLNGEEENEIKSERGARFRFMMPSDTPQFREYHPNKDAGLFIKLTGQNNARMDSLMIGIFVDSGSIQERDYQVESLSEQGGGFFSRTLAYFYSIMPEERFIGYGRKGSIEITSLSEEVVEGKLKSVLFRTGSDGQAVRVSGKFKANNNPGLQPRKIPVSQDVTHGPQL
jgi:hypothetical protein